MLMDKFDRYARRHQPYKGGSWCYEDGLVYRGLECLHQATGEDRWLDHIVRMVDGQLKDGPALAGYELSEYNIDNVQSGRALLYLHDVTGEARYLEAAEILARQLQTHPRTRSGVYWHKLRYPWQVWLDGLYMGPPFQIGYGQRIGDMALVEDALTQIDMAMKMSFVAATGLYAHGVDETKNQIWADPETGHSRAHWARALGWLAMALVDVAELVGPALFAPLSGRTRDLMERVAGLRRSNGLWLQVIDQPDLEDNFTETSASAMFVYALLKANGLGLWTGSTSGLLDMLLGAAIRPAADGGVEMVEICHVAGLGPYEGRYRDGTAEYYVTEHCVADDPKGVGPLMMAVATSIAQSDAATAALTGE